MKHAVSLGNCAEVVPQLAFARRLNVNVLERTATPEEEGKKKKEAEIKQQQ